MDDQDITRIRPWAPFWIRDVGLFAGIVSFLIWLAIRSDGVARLIFAFLSIAFAFLSLIIVWKALRTEVLLSSNALQARVAGKAFELIWTDVTAVTTSASPGRAAYIFHTLNADYVLPFDFLNPYWLETEVKAHLSPSLFKVSALRNVDRFRELLEQLDLEIVEHEGPLKKNRRWLNRLFAAGFFLLWLIPMVLVATGAEPGDAVRIGVCASPFGLLGLYLLLFASQSIQADQNGIQINTFLRSFGTKWSDIERVYHSPTSGMYALDGNQNRLVFKLDSWFFGKDSRLFHHLFYRNVLESDFEVETSLRVDFWRTRRLP